MSLLEIMKYQTHPNHVCSNNITCLSINQVIGEPKSEVIQLFEMLIDYFKQKLIQLRCVLFGYLDIYPFEIITLRDRVVISVVFEGETYPRPIIYLALAGDYKRITELDLRVVYFYEKSTKIAFYTVDSISHYSHAIDRINEGAGMQYINHLISKHETIRNHEI